MKFPWYFKGFLDTICCESLKVSVGNQTVFLCSEEQKIIFQSYISEFLPFGYKGYPMDVTSNIQHPTSKCNRWLQKNRTKNVTQLHLERLFFFGNHDPSIAEESPMPRLYLLLGVVTGPLRSLILLAAWLFICKSSEIYIIKINWCN